MKPKAQWAAVLTAMIYPAILTLVYFVWLADSDSTLQQLAYGIGKTLQFVLPVTLAVWIWHDRLRWPRPNSRGLLLGAAFGLVIVAGMCILYFPWLKPQGKFEAEGAIMRSKVISFGITTPLLYAAMSIFYSLLHSLLEEYYWRWFVFRKLHQLTQLWPAIAISSLAFMAHHVVVLGTYLGWNSPWTWAFSAATGIGGAFWAWLYNRTGSLYGPWLSHMIIDAGIFAIGYDLIGLS
jgi:membrane protease YdiL (CAAX protease family)